MGLYKKLGGELKEVDVIIAGGGTAACIIAGRLAEADPELSILLIEGGHDNYQDPKVVTPLRFMQHLHPNSDSTLFYKAIKNKKLADRECIVPSGGILGGGSSINFLMYTRAQRDDYDAWNTPGWTADEVFPYLNKLETYHGPGSSDHHGSSGPVHISNGTHRETSSENDWLAAAKAVGYPEIKDLQTLDSNNGFQRWLRYASPEGKRSDTAHAYLHPMLKDGKHPNLHVLVESKVVRVLFDDDKKACGVEYMPNPQFQLPNDVEDVATPASKHTVKARKLVVVSCGACGSPSVLERSGVGSAEVLKKARVPVVEDLPGVGHDYQDHHLVLYPYKSGLQPHETHDEFYFGRRSYEDATEAKDPRLGWNTIDITGKLRPTEADVDALGPEFKQMWEKDFKDKPNRPLILMALLNGFYGDPSTVEYGQYATAGMFTAYPYSRGYIHITGPEVTDTLDFDVGFFSDENDIDVKKQLWAYKKSREIMRRTNMYRGELPGYHPPFPADSKAACVTVETAGALGDLDSIKDIEYSPEDDKLIIQFLRENINTTWHSLGTVKMAPREQNGVVDRNLNVYGVKGLKVADLGIAPENVGANTNNTALMIGEKAADIIKEELGLHK
ncbi:GMC oxidoreductase [Xylariaceae sp. FL0016]|nr:GMC oxidoreductase [Xylariaceae sp. FL0016]